MTAAVSSLAARAQTVFLGQVTAVHVGGRVPSTAGQSGAPGVAAKIAPGSKVTAPPGVALVEFRVDAVLKGAVGATYKLREWSGLWSGGTPRYWVGERAVMFVSAASGAGFVGPVDGMEGVVPVAGFEEGQPLLDITRVRSSLQRAAGAPMADAGARLSVGQVAGAGRASGHEPAAAPVAWQPYPGRLPVVTQDTVPSPELPARSLPVINRPLPAIKRPLQSLPLRSPPAPGGPMSSRWRTVEWGVLAGMLLCSGAPALASGPRWFGGMPYYVSTQWGQPVKWSGPVIEYFTDPGDLAIGVSHAQADAAVAAAAAVWDLPQAAISLAQGGTLAEHVSSGNVYLADSGLQWPADVQPSDAPAKSVAVVYDTDGSVTDLLLGSGASAPSSLPSECRGLHGGRHRRKRSDSSRHDHPEWTLRRAFGGSDGAAEIPADSRVGTCAGLAWSQLTTTFHRRAGASLAEMQAWPLMHPWILCAERGRTSAPSRHSPCAKRTCHRS